MTGLFRRRRRSLDPSDSRLLLTSTGGGAAGTILGLFVGHLFDSAACNRTHPRRDGWIIDPCFLYADSGTGIGWFGGAALAATIVAVDGARRRGCSPLDADLRAITGTLVGIAPGVITVLRTGSSFHAPDGWIIVTAPLVSGVGAALAVLTCHLS